MAYGPRGEWAVKIVQRCFLGGVIVAVQLTAAKSLAQVIKGSGSDLCIVACHAIIASIAWVLMQIRNLKEVTWTAVAGVISIFIPLVLFMNEVSVLGPQSITGFRGEGFFGREHIDLIGHSARIRTIAPVAESRRWIRDSQFRRAVQRVVYPVFRRTHNAYVCLPGTGRWGQQWLGVAEHAPHGEAAQGCVTHS